MGRYKVNNDGTLGAMISGRGKAEYGASTVRKGSLSVTGIPKVGSSPTYKEITVTFDSPMPDANYELETSVGYQAFVFTAISNKTANGFRAVFTSIYTNSDIDITFTYTAYKLYTDTEYNNILAAMPSDASASNKVITRSTIGVNSSASHKIAPGVTGAQVLAEAIWGMIKTDGSPESGVMPVMYEGHDYGIVMYGYLWEGTVKWCVYSLFLIASGTFHFRAKANVGTDEVIIYTS